ncbi:MULTISPECIES: hypothetical protein [Bacillaceae]|uniref:hypothetical protein n=1 Tax=Bacillaceae TaxID=186817 RepID=UPI000BFCCC86|nr:MULTISPECIES: hypothetical protein [Bacillaceae]PGT90587.1 hypothetical protein COD11_02705 [Bacillus sp. AFS040349]UGB30909.1 hypothetical protein LPC09_25035 [Metabacillus sp. B2-18]
MNKKGAPTIKRGQAITFRLPSDTPDHLVRQLEKLKQTEKRNFSSTIADFVLEGVGSSLKKEKEMITLPLPKQLSKDQRNWLKHSHSEALMGSIVYQLLSDPVRATSILASLTSNSLDIDEALYLQEVENVPMDVEVEGFPVNQVENNEEEESVVVNALEDDIADFDIFPTENEVAATIEGEAKEDEPVDDLSDLLGDFLASMNK